MYNSNRKDNMSKIRMNTEFRNKILKAKYGQPLDVVAKDKCFYFSYAKDELEENEDEDDRNVSEHFDFGLFGSVGNSEYGDETGKQFAYAYKRE